jgi:20S proteasome alpha/beta subunit
MVYAKNKYMNKEQAIQIIEQALNQATQKGAFNLNEVTQVILALEFIKKQAEDKK